MATMATPAPQRSFRGLIDELMARQRLLGGYGLACMAIFVPLFVATFGDPRQIGDVSIWLKPAKFFLSIGVFAVTMGWFFGYWRAERRGSWLEKVVVATILVAGTFELVWITWQGAHREMSHLNFESWFTRRMFNLMGVGAVALVMTCLLMAWEIARRPVTGLDPAYRLAVLLGLVLTFALGGSLGGHIAANGGAAVGSYSSGIPLFAWNQIGGDLRIAHFLGMHAQQALPLFATGLTALGLRCPNRWIAIAAIAYAGLVAAVWFQALAGDPLLAATAAV